MADNTSVLQGDYELISSAWRDHSRWKACLNQAIHPDSGTSELNGVQLWILAGAVVDILKVAEAFGNTSLQERMKADANAALESLGMPAMSGVTFKLIVNTSSFVQIVLPGPPFGDGSCASELPTPSMNQPDAYPWEDVGPVVAYAWAHADFRAHFLENPRAILNAYVGEVPADIEVCALANTEHLVHLVLWETT